MGEQICKINVSGSNVLGATWVLLTPIVHFYEDKQGNTIHGKGFGTGLLFFFGRFDRLKTAIEHQVVNDLKSTRQKEGQIH
jgi:hypothetical protein